MAKSLEQVEAAEAAPPAQAAPRTETRNQEKNKPKRLPPYAVVLHNDRINGFDHVIRVLRKVFHYGGGKAFLLTLRAHVGGRCIVWTGSLEVAELKAQQVHDCGPDPAM